MTDWATKKKVNDSNIVDNNDIDDNDGNSAINLIFGTGVTYLNYLWTKSFHFVVHEDLAAVQEIHRSVFGRNSKTLFFTSLKILSSPGAATSAGTSSGPTESQSVRPSNDNEASNVAEDEHSRDRKSGVDVSLLHIPRHPPGVEIRPFHMTSQSLVPDVSEPEDKKRVGSLRDLHLSAFKTITGVDPEVDKIRAVVVFNVCEMIHVLR